MSGSATDPPTSRDLLDIEIARQVQEAKENEISRMAKEKLLEQEREDGKRGEEP